MIKKYSRIEFLELVKNNKDASQIKNGTEFNVFKGNKKIGVIAIQRTNIVYVDIPRDVFDLLNSDEYSFSQIIEK